MTSKIALRAFAFVCLGVGCVSAFGVLLELAAYNDPRNPWLGITPLIKAAGWALVCAVCFKAGHTWLRETADDWKEWQRQRADTRLYKAAGQDEWWLRGYPFRERWAGQWLNSVDRKNFEQFKKDVTEWGYSPNGLALDDTVARRWMKLYYSRVGDPRADEH